jgi:hypothetical protein
MFRGKIPIKIPGFFARPPTGFRRATRLSLHSLADVPAYLDRVGIFRDFNAAFFRLPASVLAGRLIGELEKAGAVICADGWLRPA